MRPLQVLKSLLTHCRRDLDSGRWFGTFFVRFSAIWVMRFHLGVEAGVDHLDDLHITPCFPLSDMEDPGLPLLSHFHKHLAIWPPATYPCKADKNSDQSRLRPTLTDLLQMEETIPEGFKVLFCFFKCRCQMYSGTLWDCICAVSNDEWDVWSVIASAFGITDYIHPQFLPLHHAYLPSGLWG